MASYMEPPGDDAISLTLSRYDPKELVSVISGLKHVLSQNEAQGRAMLSADKDLTYAILQAELLMGLIDETVVANAMQSVNISADQTDVQGNAPVQVSSGFNGNNAVPSSSHAQTAQTAQTVQIAGSSTNQPLNPPNTASNPSNGTPNGELNAAGANPYAGMNEQQIQAIKQIISIPDEQLNLLPAEQQQQVRQLRVTYNYPASV